jgi:hypothetical protein
MIKKITTDTMPLSVRQSSRSLYMHSAVIASFYLICRRIYCYVVRMAQARAGQNRLILLTKPQI